MDALVAESVYFILDPLWNDMNAFNFMLSSCSLFFLPPSILSSVMLLSVHICP